MAKSAAYYSLNDFYEYKRKQGKCVPPRVNVLAAACHIQQLFDAKKFTYGFMGGLPMLCLGYKREMPDLHIAYDDKDFERLKSKLENDRRVRLPTGVNPLLPFKILVWTGPEYKDQGCLSSASIEIDLVPSGACGTPRAGDLTRSLILTALKTAGDRQLVFKSLNVQYLLATMLSYCKARDLSWDPRKDILFLCKNQTVEVQRIRGRLNVKEVKEMFLGTSFFSRLHMQDQQLCYRTLLDTEPPPTMAITPPALQPLAPPQSKQRVSEQPDDIRAPRSRYRNVSGQRSSSDNTAGHGVTRDARVQSTDRLQDPRRFTQIEGVQWVHSAKPQPVSAAAAAKQARKSMPNLMALRRPVPTTLENSAPLQQQNSTPRAGRMTSGVKTSSPHQGNGSSLLEYGGSFQPAHTRATSSTGTAGQDVTIGRGSTTVRTGSTRSDSTETSEQGIRSQKGSLHFVSPGEEVVPCQQYLEEESASKSGRLQLVGPEGVYGAPEILQKSVQLQPQHQRHWSAPPARTEPPSAFELDATVAPRPTLVAELSADSIETRPVEQRKTEQPPMESPDTVRPLNIRKMPAPLEAGTLPASLVAGGSTTHSYRQSISHIEHDDDSRFGFSTRQTNAYRYSLYALPQSMSSNTPQMLSAEATGPVYKAYRPFVATHELDRNDSVSSVYSPVHRRDTSHDSTASHVSDKLADEYRELLNFEDGYGAKGVPDER